MGAPMHTPILHEAGNMTTNCVLNFINRPVFFNTPEGRRRTTKVSLVNERPNTAGPPYVQSIIPWLNDCHNSSLATMNLRRIKRGAVSRTQVGNRRSNGRHTCIDGWTTCGYIPSDNLPITPAYSVLNWARDVHDRDGPRTFELLFSLTKNMREALPKIRLYGNL